MKSAPAPLIALLNSGQQFSIADLLTITLKSGTVLRYTSWDSDQTYNAHVFSSTGPLFERGRTRVVIGVEVDTLDLTLWPKPTDMVGAQTWMQAAASGALDGADVLLERAFMDGTFAIVGGYINFTGRWADFTLGRTEIKETVRSDLELLNVQIPRNLYQAGCLHTLYDTDCGIDRATFASASSIVTASRTALTCGLSQPDGYFDMGYIVFTGGALTGTRRTVKAQIGGALALLNPLPMVPGIGDTFTAYPGCAKTQAVCTSKFSNLSNFRGFPFVPQPETAR